MGKGNISFTEVKLFLLSNLLTLGGLFILALAILTTRNTLIKCNITNKNKEVLAKVIEAPTSCKNITKRGGYCKLEYNEKVFVIKAGRKFCHLVSGKKNVIMLSNENNDKLIFTQEYKPIDFLYSFILLLLGIYIIIKGYNNHFKN